MHSLKQAIGKCRQLISTEKERISQLQSECIKLSGKAAKLESFATELQREVQKPKSVADRIIAEKRVSVQLEEEITGLEACLGEKGDIERAVNKASEELSIFRGEKLQGLSLPQCAQLFAQKCAAVRRISEAVHEKLQSLEDYELCIVCVCAPRNVVLVPCGHLVLCSVCCSSLKHCPVCRAAIEDRFETNCGGR